MRPTHEPDSPFIECIVRTSDGGFESSLKVPVGSTAEQRNGFAKMWINMLADAMKLVAAPSALTPPAGDDKETK